MFVKTDNLYSFSQAAKILGVTLQRLFELSATPYVERVHQENRIYFTNDSIRKLVLRGDVWYVNTKLDNFFKVSLLIINRTFISEGSMNSYAIKPVNIVL